jgi:site-specific recombinase XerD
VSDPDLAVLLDSWLLALRAERKAKGTLAAYGGGVRAFLAWCAAEGRPAVLDRATVSAWIAALLDNGQEGATATARQLAVRRFSTWLADEGEIDHDDLVGLKPPKIDTKIVEPLTDDEIRLLLKACAGLEPFRDRRDEAIVRAMLETGLRAGEVVSMTISDTHLTDGSAIIRRGKSGKGRVVPFGPSTVRALDRYLRARRTHRLAATDAFWLGAGGKGFGYEGLHKALTERARMAGLVGFHPHRLRHTWAHRWLENGGSESGAMSIGGWSRPDMLMRYSRAQASARALAEARKLQLGEL